MFYFRIGPRISDGPRLNPLILKRTFILGKIQDGCQTYFLLVLHSGRIFFFFFNYPADFLAIFAASTTDM